MRVAGAGSAEEERLGQVTWTFLVPSAVEPGPARLVTGDSEPAQIRVQVRVRVQIRVQIRVRGC